MESEINRIPFFQEVLKQPIKGDLQHFWSSIKILVTSPHYINRKIICSKCIYSGQLDIINENILLQKLFTFEESSSFVDQLKSKINCIIEIIVKDIFDLLLENESKYFIICNENFLKKNIEENKNFEVFVINLASSCLYVFSFCEDGKYVTLTHPKPYVVQYVDNTIMLKVFKEDSQNTKLLNWLQNKLLKKLITWSEPQRNVKLSPTLCPSLSFVNKEDYAKLYSQLKSKYGKSMCAIWPDNTDPSKFVFEDIAIATYILLIWEQERYHKKSNEKQSFVDLGCGNGLLVHILNSEGFPGYGLDIRKRDLWNKYPSTTILKEKPFIPTTDTFNDIDWLIGNHSDEITPWLPITALRSSIKTNYFVIPCCPFELNGKKYQRKSSNNTVYEDFIYHVKNISEICGFDTKIDRLRIPSTKRTCLVGWNRNEEQIENYKELCKTVETFVQKECFSMNNYTVRDKIEKVQNCTQINKNIQEEIVKIIANTLLSKTNTVNEWNKGGSINIKELAELLPKDLLSELKSECGGLQTLLKNQNIFNIKNGVVCLNRPKTIQQMKELYIIHKTSDNRVILKRKALQKTSKTKCIKVDDVDFDMLLQKKNCWYFYNHPQGCPLSDQNCSFKHGLDRNK